VETSSPACPLLTLVFGVVWSLILATYVPRLLRHAGMTRRNFQNTEVVTAGGLIVVLGAVPTLVLARRCDYPDGIMRGALVWALVCFGLLGFADDRWGTPAAKGIRGHLRALFRDRRVTSGLIKAVGGLATAFWIAFGVLHLGLVEGCACALSTALGANAINLLDLRPGRAGAVAILGLFAALIGLMAAGMRGSALAVGSLIAVAVVVQVHDARGWLMLGDTGSNALGACMALAVWIAFPSYIFEAIFLLALVGLHVVAERRSLTALIEANAVLRWVDGLTGLR